MADTRTYYVLCDDNCRFESMTKEQIITAIAEATGATPTSIDDAFITKIKESNRNGILTFWKGTEAELIALGVTTTAYKVGIDSNGKLYFTPSTADIAAHASTHGTSGTDPITPASIGAATSTHASTHETSGTDPITPASIGAAASTHNHAASDINSGTLPIANGGTGASTVADARNALGLGNTSGALPVANGGTGASTVADARNALGLGNTSGALPVANGGTGATTKQAALTTLLNATNIILTSSSYGTSLPSAGTAGRLFFLKVT